MPVKPFGTLRLVAYALLLVTALCAWQLCRPVTALAADAPELGESDAAVLMDKGGNVLFGLNPEKREHPASITKVMTAMVTLDSGHRLDELVDTIAPDLGDNSQMADFHDGDKVPLGDLLRVMLVYSANDAAYNISLYVAGSEESFVARMNEKAAEIGMEHTHFSNSHGLEDDNHYTCALDMAKMCRHALMNYPFIAQTALLQTAEAPIQGETYVFRTTDRLLDTFEGIRGLKTGAIVNNYTFLGASGRGNTQLYTAVLGCQTFMGRFDDAAALMEWGYANYANKTVALGSWTVRTHPYAYNFLLSCEVRPTHDYTLRTWPSGGSCSYATVLAKPHRLIDTGRVYGFSSWRQAGSDLGEVIYGAQDAPVRTSAWPIFTRPLFDTAAHDQKDAAHG
jgi:D-alanyl-D-alanine carboxypeptidase (penicillin-binding protein 5/6)